MALPAIADVRKTWPGARMAVAARPAIAPLFSLVPGVDDIVLLPAGGGSPQATADALGGGAFEAAILFPNSFQVALAARKAGIPERWGYRASLRGRLLTRAVTRPEGLHQAALYQQLARELGCANGPMQPELRVPEAARAAGAALLRDAGWAGRAPLVAIAPGAAFGGAKRWPAQSFARAALALEADGAQIVIVGAAADKAAGDEVRAAMHGAAYDLVGKTDLPTLAGVFASSRAVVTNDSGAMHLAAALGVAVTAMFGPTRERETTPLTALGGPAAAVLTHDVWCRPCMLRECPLAHGCMRGITVEAVVSAARHSL